jgi:hypothetical protein
MASSKWSFLISGTGSSSSTSWRGGERFIEKEKSRHRERNIK